MVSISYGGLSLYESYTILSTARTGYPLDWVEMFNYILNTYNPVNNEFPNSFEEDIYGLTYRWFSSIIHIKPFDYYRNINIPILFVHGNNDYNVPVESTGYIQQNLPEKPFEYYYYNWDHQPHTKPDILQFRKEIAEWIMNNS
jgi:pimeloyl-ACP methyl ester carboxylesterase